MITCQPRPQTWEWLLYTGLIVHKKCDVICIYNITSLSKSSKWNYILLKIVTWNKLIEFEITRSIIFPIFLTICNKSFESYQKEVWRVNSNRNMLLLLKQDYLLSNESFSKFVFVFNYCVVKINGSLNSLKTCLNLYRSSRYIQHMNFNYENELGFLLNLLNFNTNKGNNMLSAHIFTNIAC